MLFRLGKDKVINEAKSVTTDIGQPMAVIPTRKQF